ncbi:MAG TPA: phage tail tape measure protein, partial [Pseudonocardia sp.]
MTTRTVSVWLKAQVADYVQKIGSAKKATGQFLAETDKLAKDHRDKFNQLTLGAGAAGLAMLGATAGIVKIGMQFDKQMSAVGAVAEGTADDLAHLRDAALAAGKATSFSATEAAKAEEELAKAGIKTTDILSGGLTGALNLAAAGQMELADAATIAAQAMNVFQLNGSAVPHIADVLAAASNKSAAGMKDLGDALKMSGLVSAQTGLSLEQTVGTLAAFADRALIGSDAGTSLKTMLQMLQAPSEKTAKL